MKENYRLPLLLAILSVILIGLTALNLYLSFSSEDRALRRAVVRTAAVDCGNSAITKAIQRANLDLDRQIFQYTAGQITDSGIKRALLAGVKAKEDLIGNLPAPPDCKHLIDILNEEGIQLPENLKIVDQANKDPYLNLQELLQPEVDPSKIKTKSR